MNSSIWIKGLRSINNMVLAIMLISSIIGGVVAGVAIGGFVGFLSTIAITIVGSIISFLLVSFVMIFLDLAEDISYIASIIKQGDNFFDMFEEEKRKRNEQEILSNGGWKCSKCGKINLNYTGTCGCGNNKYNN